MENTEKRVREFVGNNLIKLEDYAGEDDYCESSVSYGRYLILYDTTVGGWIVRLSNEFGIMFTMYSDGNVHIKDLVGTWIFFKQEDDTKLMDKVEYYT